MKFRINVLFLNFKILPILLGVAMKTHFRYDAYFRSALTREGTGQSVAKFPTDVT